MRRMVRTAVVLFSFAAALAACGEPPPQQGQGGPPTVTVAKPKVKKITEWDEYTGRFEAVAKVEVRARVSGYLTQKHFNDGDIVNPGALLYSIDDRPFRRSLEEAQSELESARTRLKFAERDRERAESLAGRGNISQQVLDQRLREEQEAAAAVKAAEARVRRLQLDVEFTEIRSPVRGRVSDNLVSVGNYISGGSPNATLLTTIVTLDPIHFVFDVSETAYLKYLRLDRSGERPSSRVAANPVYLSLRDETGFPHKGEMDFVDNRFSEGTGTMRGRAVFGNKEQIFVPGLFGRIRLIGSAPYDAVLLPPSAVATDQASKFVYVVGDDGTVERKAVVLGPVIGGLQVVRKGLSADEKVVVKGLQRVRPGSKVTPQDSTVDKVMSGDGAAGGGNGAGAKDGKTPGEAR